jgi:hypothetical protein
MHFFNILGPNGNYIYHQVSYYEILRFAQRNHLDSVFCVELATNNEHFPTLYYQSILIRASEQTGRHTWLDNLGINTAI